MKYIFIHGLGQGPDSWNKTVSCMREQEEIQCLNVFAFKEGSEISYRKVYKAFSAYCEIFRLMPNGIFKKMGIGKRELIQLTKSMMVLDFKEDLDKVDCRTLIVCGEKDRANRGASEMMAEKIHGARIKILEGCGHEVNVEAPEKLAEILEAFYEEK